ncbi:MAG: hypothetical protein A2664_04630 [Candidatus Taylorbacteria bacterium RIFCSPHIGHO2_01_FULL_46_22b]|uniref:Uncharacterized protein n=1 Tax=Candidatus Taylorbacteria bacterium RIFCSPHIGHO2_01_FULL_46_22b TaxID=1802301 RepID=A0A1G2M4R8_9BACT|nr:MAG: hypothetical protein A2664_04630 [Candidatus Taylorbacteria bacterium RIFCSPHIGHO2_01_FULL_46_22b]
MTATTSPRPTGVLQTVGCLDIPPFGEKAFSIGENFLDDQQRTTFSVGPGFGRHCLHIVEPNLQSSRVEVFKTIGVTKWECNLAFLANRWSPVSFWTIFCIATRRTVGLESLLISAPDIFFQVHHLQFSGGVFISYQGGEKWFVDAIPACDEYPSFQAGGTLITVPAL